MSEVTWPKVIAIGLVLGLMAGAVVWYLERFEVGRLHTEIREYLGHHDAFLRWQEEQHGDS